MPRKDQIKNPSGYHSSGRTRKEKVVNFALFIKEFGWTGSWEENSDTEIVTLVAKRDNERIEIEYAPASPWPDVYYTLLGHTIKCRNISMAAKIAQGQPDAERVKRAVSRRHNGIATPSSSTPSKPLLNYLEDASEDDIGDALIGDSITWLSGLGGEPQTDRILPKQFKVTANKEGRTIIHFCGDFGFHSVYLDRIVNVS
jgi:hypothetical protein